MRIEVETTLTKRLLRCYLTYTVHRRQKGKAALTLAACLLLVALSCGMLLLDPTQPLGFIGLAFAALFLAGFATMPRWAAALQWRNVSKDLATQRFAFGDDAAEVANDASGRVQGRSTVRYAGLLQAVADRDAFYLFIQRNQAFIVDRSKFPAGADAELAARLKEVCGRKWVDLRG